MKKQKSILIVFLFLCIVSFAQTKSYFSQESLDCIVLLEKKIDSLYVPHGTGFIVYNYSEKIGYDIVTCEHLLRNKEIYVCIPANPTFVEKMKELNIDSIIFDNQVWHLTENKLRTKYELIKNKTFIVDSIQDIGVFSLKFYNIQLDNDSIEVKTANIKGIPKSWIKYKKDILLGTDVYFTGFPLYIGTDLGFYNTGLYSDNIPNPLVRKGSVAWKSEFNDQFLLDAFSYGGNSGSPIFTISDILNKGVFIGMIFGHLPSEKSENIGLAKCIWSDKIMELIEEYDKLK